MLPRGPNVRFSLSPHPLPRPSEQAHTPAPVGLLAIYFFGFVSFSATVVRLQKSITFRNTKSSRETQFALQPTYTFFTSVEINTAIVCANLPALSALLRYTRFGKSYASRSSSKPSSGPSDRQLRPSGLVSVESQASVVDRDTASPVGVSLTEKVDGKDGIFGSAIVRTTEVTVDVERGGGETQKLE